MGGGFLKVIRPGTIDRNLTPVYDTGSERGVWPGAV